MTLFLIMLLTILLSVIVYLLYDIYKLTQRLKEVLSYWSERIIAFHELLEDIRMVYLVRKDKDKDKEMNNDKDKT